MNPYYAQSGVTLTRYLLWAVLMVSVLLGVQRVWIVLQAQAARDLSDDVAIDLKPAERPTLTRLECEATTSNLACLAFLSGSVVSIETTITVKDRSGQTSTRTVTTVPSTVDTPR